MNVNFDDTDIELTCPGCGNKFKEKVGRLKNDPTVDCPDCHKSIHIEASGFRAGLKAADDAVEEFKRTIEGLNKGR